jgi:hypothetical protein
MQRSTRNSRLTTRAPALIVIDASTVVGAALKREGVLRRALVKARRENVIALSQARIRSDDAPGRRILDICRHVTVGILYTFIVL